jgi:hypothetical protein
MTCVSTFAFGVQLLIKGDATAQFQFLSSLRAHCQARFPDNKINRWIGLTCLFKKWFALNSC